jgi:peroxiredoxin Q/BCP
MATSKASAHDSPLLLGDGRTVRLSDYRGHWLVLYFYPKDNTPGCTLEGIDFNVRLPDFRAAGADVLGVSRDSVASHAGFCAKHGFTFDLVSDPLDALADAFGVIGEKTLYGRRFVGVVRSTFLLDPTGAIAAEWRGVKVPGHADAVLAELRRLVAGGPRMALAPVAKNAAAKKVPAKKAPATKAGAKKTVAKTPAAKTPAAKKPAAKKSPARKAVANKAVARKPAAKKAPAKKAARRK